VSQCPDTFMALERATAPIARGSVQCMQCTSDPISQSRSAAASLQASHPGGLPVARGLYCARAIAELQQWRQLQGGRRALASWPGGAQAGSGGDLPPLPLRLLAAPALRQGNHQASVYSSSLSGITHGSSNPLRHHHNHCDSCRGRRLAICGTGAAPTPAPTAMCTRASGGTTGGTVPARCPSPAGCATRGSGRRTRRTGGRGWWAGPAWQAAWELVAAGQGRRMQPRHTALLG
jgi:hypothetical protein